MRTSDRLLARLRAMGLDLPPGTVLRRTHAPRSGRAAGAWSWYATDADGYELGIGGHHSMGTVLAARRLYASQDSLISTDITVEPTPLMHPPGGQWTPDALGRTLYEVAPAEPDTRRLTPAQEEALLALLGDRHGYLPRCSDRGRERLRYDAYILTTTADALQRRGLVTPVDFGRAGAVRLTEAGRARAEQIKTDRQPEGHRS